jgi:hypothetical protein
VADLHRRALLDRHLPGWLDTSHRDDAGWVAWLDQAVAFYAQHGHLPPKRTPVGRWLARQRQTARGQRNITMDPQRQALLDERLPGWLA